ncbi:hypothetical protein LINPERPRIM_LOCUS30709, partial [Linum perenne]
HVSSFSSYLVNKYPLTDFHLSFLPHQTLTIFHLVHPAFTLLSTLPNAFFSSDFDSLAFLALPNFFRNDLKDESLLDFPNSCSRSCWASCDVAVPLDPYMVHCEAYACSVASTPAVQRSSFHLRAIREGSY